MNVWLDDIKDPKTFAPGGFLDRMDARGEPEKDWIWVHNKDEFKKVLDSTEGRIEIMSFDHDLGAYEPTGYDIIKWLEQEYLDRYPRKTWVHSGNPSGAKNIEMFDKNVRKHLLNE